MVGIRPKKTALMLLIESKDPEKREIERILIDAFRVGGSQRKAAKIINISPALCSQWVYRFGLEHTVREVLTAQQKGA